MPLKNPELTKFSTASPILMSYNWTDIATGLGYVSFYPSVIEQDAVLKYSLDVNTLLVSSTAGTLKNDSWFFETSIFNSSKTIKGNAYLSGYTDWSTNDSVVSGQLIKLNSNYTSSKGSVVDSDATEYSESSPASDVVVKTFELKGERVFEVVSDIKVEGDYGVANTHARFYYAGGSSVRNNVPTTTYTSKTYTNPSPEKLVDKITIELSITAGTGGANAVYVKNTDVYGLLNSVRTEVSDEISSILITADRSWTLKIPCSETYLDIGDILVLRVKSTGSNSAIICDPTNQVQTEPSLKLNIPFKIDQ